jgi:hypothetical protein
MKSTRGANLAGFRRNVSSAAQWRATQAFLQVSLSGAAPHLAHACMDKGLPF